MNPGRVKSIMEAFGIDLEAHAQQNGDASVEAMFQRIAESGRTEDQLVASLFRAYPDRTDDFVKALFESRGITDIATGDETEQQRLDRIASELASGRTLQDLRNSLDNLAAPGGGGGGGAAGGGDNTQDDGVVDVGNTVVPGGATVVRVRNPAGSDAPTLWYLKYQFAGVEFVFEVGTSDDFIRLFGNDWQESDFYDSFITQTQGQFDASGYVDAGMVDEVVGSEDSFASQMEAAIQAAGQEDIVGWIRNDPQAMAVFAESVVDDWSKGRLWRELSGTDAFADRFPAMERYMQGGITVEQAVNEYVQDETALRITVRRFLPPGTQVDQDYLGTVMMNGWTPNQANQILQATETLKRRPEALAQANAIMIASGLDPMDEAGMLNVLTGGAPDEVVEAFNTASAAQALADADLADVDVDLLIEVVDDVTALRSKEDYQRLAQDLALDLIRNARELDIEQYGMTREDVIAAAFGESNPGGKSIGETINYLARLERERQVAAQGLAGVNAFIDDRDRLRTQGFRNI